MNKPKIHTALFLVLVILLLVILYFSSNQTSRENWPEVNTKPEYKQIVNDSLVLYKEYGGDYKRSLQKYDTFGDFLNWGIITTYRESEELKFDDDGIPMVKYGEEFYYNPGTVAQYALTMHGKYIHGIESPTKFLVAAEKLIELQSEDGAFRYPFDWYYYLTEEYFKAGWFSGMDSGQALSVFSRAYHMTKDSKYLGAGNKAFKFMITPINEGGPMDTLEDLDPSLNEYIIFEEYLAEPASYTLNGFMFSVIGLYDWVQIDSDTRNEAQEYYEKGIKTLEKILPYYDIGGFTAYDLGHINYDKLPLVNVSYHPIHIQFCNIFYQLTGKEIFAEYYKKWLLYVDEL